MKSLNGTSLSVELGLLILYPINLTEITRKEKEPNLQIIVSSKAIVAR